MASHPAALGENRARVSLDVLVTGDVGWKELLVQLKVQWLDEEMCDSPGTGACLSPQGWFVTPGEVGLLLLELPPVVPLLMVSLPKELLWLPQENP